MVRILKDNVRLRAAGKEILRSVAMKQEKWSSEFGFLMAASGSAVGLGNIWKFPYIAGQNGGAVFIIIYFILMLLLGVPVLLSEMAIGRSTGKNPVDACRTISPKCGFIGAFGIMGAYVILSYYCVIGGWIIKFLISFLTGNRISSASDYFEEFTSGSVPPLVYALIFTVICGFIVLRGVSGGIEKISRIFMPALIFMMLLLIIRSLSLEGGIEGVRFFLLPDFSHIKSAGDFFTVLINAMGQVFFSLSLGMGTLITYGAYLDKSASLTKASVYIPLIDFIIALLAGLMVLPAVFAYDIPPQAGSGMIFIALTQVFGEISGGRVFGVIFFLLVLFAAVTSAISLLEVLISFVVQKTGSGRKTAAVLSAAAVFAAAVPVSLSFGRLSGFTVFGMNFFDLMNFISDKLLMPMGALGICLLCGYVWGTKGVTEEADMKNGAAKALYRILVRYAAPVMIAVIFVTALAGL